MTEAMRRLRIAQVAPPVERVPPAAYGGTERVVHELATQLVDRGHDVTVFASGDSHVPGKLVPTVERALRPAGIENDAGGWFATTVKMVVEQAKEFDVIHSHLEWWSIPLARLSPVPVVATFHGRLDLPWADRLFRDAPDGMVAISRHQASTHPDVPWTIIHNGLTLDTAPFRDQPGDAFCFVGRVDAEKGIIEAIDIARRAGRHLRIAAKVGNLARQRDYYENVFRPVLQRAGHSVEYLGEIRPAERDQLFAESYATLMPGAWPEPFGLVSIESLACGTPVLARRVGALPEIIREGVDGFFGDDAAAMAFFADRLGSLDRREIRERVIERFSAARMADRYEELYARMVEEAEASTAPPERVVDADAVAEALAADLPTEVTEPEDVELPEYPSDSLAAVPAAEQAALNGASPEAATAGEEAAAAVEAPAAQEATAAEEATAPAEPLEEAPAVVSVVVEATLVEEAVSDAAPAVTSAEEAVPVEAIVGDATPVEGTAAEKPVGEAQPDEALAEPTVAETADETTLEGKALGYQPPEEAPVKVMAAALDETSGDEAAAAEALGEVQPEEAPVAEAEAEAPRIEVPVDMEMPAGLELEAAAIAEAPVDEAPVHEAPVAEAPVAETMAIETAVIEATMAEARLEDGRRGEAATAEAQVVETVGDESALAAAPVAEAPVAEAPVAEHPIDEALGEEAPLEEAPTATSQPTAPPTDKNPVAVGPGLNTTQPRAMVPPTTPAPPTPATPPTTPAPQAPPAPRPAAKRRTKPISGVFTRLWSGSTRKAAGGRRRNRP
jgi:glycosyltransferase involved in cell wall biosynthesis